MSEKPLVSVILPAKNCGPHLSEAVDSVLEQSLDSLELIIVNDHTTDGSIQSLNRDDHRLKVVPNSGSGLVDALNTGASKAKGEFYARMDGDDICHPDRLKLQVEYLIKNPQVGIASCLVEIFNNGPVAEGYRLYEGWVNSLVTPNQIRREMFVESPLPHPTVIFRADVFHKLGGYRDKGWPEDYDMWLRAMEAGVSMGKVNTKLLKWRDGPSRLSKTSSVYSRENFMRARAHFLARNVLKNRSGVIWGAGKTGTLLGRYLRREGASISEFIDVNPRKIGGRKMGAPVTAPYVAMDNGIGPILVAVASRGAMDEIRGFLDYHGKAEGADYYCAAR